MTDLSQEIAMLTQKVLQLENTVQELADKEAIRDVLARYGFRFDLGRYEKWYELWTDDLVFSSNNPVTGAVGRTEGKEKLKSQFGTEPKAHSTMQHLQIDVVIKVEGDTASAIGYQTMTSHQGETKPLLEKTGVRSWKLKKVNGRWLIQEAVSRNMNSVTDCRELIPEDW